MVMQTHDDDDDDDEIAGMRKGQVSSGGRRRTDDGCFAVWSGRRLGAASDKTRRDAQPTNE